MVIQEWQIGGYLIRGTGCKGTAHATYNNKGLFISTFTSYKRAKTFVNKLIKRDDLFK